MLAALDPFGVLMTIVGLGGLIFFHELGHFLACRLTGTRVEAFSIGFGKEIFGWTRKGTRYRIGVVPLGGYVKMAAENPGDSRTGAPDEFPNKPFSARLFIMSAGVLFNLILAFALFAWAFGIGVPGEGPGVGRVRVGSPAWRAGVRAGDVILEADGHTILGYKDLVMDSAIAGEDPVVLKVQRGANEEKSTFETAVTAEPEGPLAFGIDPALMPEARVIPGSAVALAGGEDGDVVLAVDGEPVGSPYDMDEALARRAGLTTGGGKETPVVLAVRRKDGTAAELKVAFPLLDQPLVGITPYEGVRIEAIAQGSGAAGFLRVGDEIVRINGAPVGDLGVLREAATDEPVTECVARRDGTEITPAAGMTVRELASAVAGRSDPKGSRIAPRKGGPADRAGVRAGDRITRAAGKPVASFEDLTLAIRANGLEPIEIELERDLEKHSLRVEPGRWPGELGYRHGAVIVTHRERNVLRAAAMGWQQTTRLIEQVLLTVKGLVTRRVSSKNIGGPILLVQATYTMFDQGWGLYLHILGLISVNLAILNLLPIPILDGGQILLLTAEKLRGKPLPERVIGYLQVAGLVLILCLVVLAFRNDITRLFQQ
jgi:regulator of sigma E protease